MAVPCPADTPSNLDKARSAGRARLNIKLSPLGYSAALDMPIAPLEGGTVASQRRCK